MFDQHEMPAAQAHIAAAERLKARAAELDQPYEEFFEARLRLRRDATELRQYAAEFQQLDPSHPDRATRGAELLFRVSNVQTQIGRLTEQHRAFVDVIQTLQVESTEALTTFIADTDPEIHGRPRSQHLQAALAGEMAALGRAIAAAPSFAGRDLPEE